jgi:hypothetical protein
MKSQRSNRKKDITQEIFENHKTNTAKTVKDENDKLRNEYVTKKFGENAFNNTNQRQYHNNQNNQNNYNNRNQNQNSDRKVIKIEKSNKPEDDNQNNQTQNNQNEGRERFTRDDSYQQSRTYDHRVNYEDLPFKNVADMKSDLDKKNYDRMTPSEIFTCDHLNFLIKRNLSGEIKNIDMETWNGKKIIFEIPENMLLSALKYKTQNKDLNIDFYDMFRQENKKNKKIVGVNLFRLLNDFDRDSNTRNTYEGYIVSGCSIAADKYNNNLWRVILFVEKSN